MGSTANGKISKTTRNRRGNKEGKSPAKKKWPIDRKNSMPHANVPERNFEEFEAAREKRLQKNSAKHAAIVQKRRGRLEKGRIELDETLRANAASKLWSLYCTWAGSRLTSAEASTPWSNEQVMCSTLCDGQRLRDIVVEKGGENYGDKVDSALPTVSALALGSSNLAASKLSASMYDSEPVVKLFSKHFKVEEQQKLLQKRKRFRSAVGTAKRVHVLCDSGHLTLEHTRVLIIDCTRDPKHRNCILEIPIQRDDLFSLLHQHCREAISKGHMKLVLHVPLSGNVDDVNMESENAPTETHQRDG